MVGLSYEVFNSRIAWLVAWVKVTGVRLSACAHTEVPRRQPQLSALQLQVERNKLPLLETHFVTLRLLAIWPSFHLSATHFTESILVLPRIEHDPARKASAFRFIESAIGRIHLEHHDCRFAGATAVSDIVWWRA